MATGVVVLLSGLVVENLIAYEIQKSYDKTPAGKKVTDMIDKVMGVSKSKMETTMETLGVADLKRSEMRVKLRDNNVLLELGAQNTSDAEHCLVDPSTDRKYEGDELERQKALTSTRRVEFYRKALELYGTILSDLKSLMDMNDPEIGWYQTQLKVYVAAAIMYFDTLEQLVHLTRPPTDKDEGGVQTELNASLLGRMRHHPKKYLKLLIACYQKCIDCSAHRHEGADDATFVRFLPERIILVHWLDPLHAPFKDGHVYHLKTSPTLYLRSFNEGALNLIACVHTLFNTGVFFDDYAFFRVEFVLEANMSDDDLNNPKVVLVSYTSKELRPNLHCANVLHRSYCKRWGSGWNIETNFICCLDPYNMHSDQGLATRSAPNAHWRFVKAEGDTYLIASAEGEPFANQVMSYGGGLAHHRDGELLNLEWHAPPEHPATRPLVITEINDVSFFADMDTNVAKQAYLKAFATPEDSPAKHTLPPWDDHRYRRFPVDDPDRKPSEK